MKTEKQFDRIVDVYSGIPLDGSISILTGRNGSGKSLVRSQLTFRTKDKSGKAVVHASMALRTGNNGAYNVFFSDTAWMPTSLNTLDFLDKASRSVGEGYLVLDEIEVGCGEETVMGIVAWLNGVLRERIRGSLGCLVITHSRYVVEHLDYDHWFNLDGYNSAAEWLNRKVVPVDLEGLKKESLELFRFVTRQGEKKGKKS